MASISKGTLKQYLKPLGEWARFCAESGSKVLEPEQHQVMDCLVKKFNEGVKAGILNIYRSALSFVMGERILGNQ